VLVLVQSLRVCGFKTHEVWSALLLSRETSACTLVRGARSLREVTERRRLAARERERSEEVRCSVERGVASRAPVAAARP